MVNASSNTQCYTTEGNASYSQSSIYPPIGVSFLDLSSDENSTPVQSHRPARLRTTRPKTAGKKGSPAPSLFGKSSPTRNSAIETDSETQSQEDWTASDSLSSLLSVSTASLAIKSPQIPPARPVYDAPPPITPAYLRYMRAEMKRSDEHCFGSVTTRETHIAREARWEARMLDLQRRIEAELAELEKERNGKSWFFRARRYS